MNDIEAQQKLLYLVLNHQDYVSQLLAENIEPDHFDIKYKTIAYALEESHSASSKCTEQYYLDFVCRSVLNGNYKKWTGSEATSTTITKLAEKAIYDTLINLERVDTADFALLCRKVRESYIKQQSKKYLDKFNENKNQDFVAALSEYAENVTTLISSGAESNSATFSTVDSYGDEWLQALEDEIRNPKQVLQTGIEPFDETMPRGLSIGSLTLIVADVGGFKSASMMNIALNVCKKYNEDVLYVSLEMPRADLMQRIISRESGIPSEKINKPAELKEEHKVKIQNAIADFKTYSNKFAILDAQERMTVSKIRAEIEKRKAYFKPRLVVIDYISILKPETSYQKLAEHSWYGQMCKDLRQLGRKMGFAVLSAVQLNREAIKSLRNQKDGKQTVGSDALRGSHDFSADADNIYVQFPHPDMPKEKLYLFCVKSRNGSTMFGKFKNQNKATLDVNAGICKIAAAVDANWSSSENFEEANEFLKKSEEVKTNNDFDLSFDDRSQRQNILEKNKQAKIAKVKQENFGFDDGL